MAAAAGPSDRKFNPIAVAVGTAPIFFMLWLYWNGLKCWFIGDDFAWLQLLQQIHGVRDFLFQMFSPMAQGTIRPWSERGFFILMQALFGNEALPFRITVFLTTAADLLLLSWIARRIVAPGDRTRAAVAGFFAPVLWIANTALVRPMTWDSAYNEVQCPLFLLGALVLLIRYLDTGRRRYWWWQLVVFVLGFGALELNVVYPALAAAWLLFIERAAIRRVLRDVAPMAVVSVIYFAIHRIAAPIPADGPYVMRFDSSMLITLFGYIKWTLLPETFYRFSSHTHRTGGAVLIIVGVALAGFVFSELRKGRISCLFGLVWYFATLAPLVPLAEHRTSYYLIIPLLGVSLIGAAAIADTWNRTVVWRGLAAIPVVLYFWAQIPVGRAETRWWLDRSLEDRGVVLGVQAARLTHPHKTIALDSITTEIFNLSLGNSPFVAFPVENVYLTPESALAIDPYPGKADLASMTLDSGTMLRAITHDEVVVYSFSGDHLRNITAQYSRSAPKHLEDRLPSLVVIGDPLFSWVLGPEWLRSEAGFRWMPGRATLRLRVPDAGAKQIEIEGYCPPEYLAKGPRHLSVLLDGVKSVETQIYNPESNFRRLLSLPAELPAGKVVEVDIRVDPVIRIDSTEYGLVFGKFAIR